MSCQNCNTNNGTPAGCRNNGNCGSGGCNKLEVYDWLGNMELPKDQEQFEIVEVRFKSTRKAFYKRAGLQVIRGDIVAVEAVSGHDIGVVSLTGELVKMQMHKKNVQKNSDLIRKLYRKAKESDIKKWHEAQELEQNTMLRAREIASGLQLAMKISDVEFQGDKTKATFYYTAEERVDFRQLIKKLAEEFRIKIEMKQIGMRQEAGRVGGIGSCGRELCCTTWLTDFRSVSTSAARYQQLALNPAKLAGQCGKLKCCLNYELDSYLDAIKDFPRKNTELLTHKGVAVLQKTDIFKRLMWFSYVDSFDNMVPIDVDRVKEIIAMNKSGKKPEDLKDFMLVAEPEKSFDYDNVVGQESLTRFDKQNKKVKKGKFKKRKKNKAGKKI